MTEMTDAEFLRWLKYWLRENDLFDAPTHDRLEALAKRLETGVIVPREPTQEWLDRFGNAAEIGSAEAKYMHRAMLQAQEASDE